MASYRQVDDILFVVYTERGDKTRLISARKANDTEEADIMATVYYFFPKNAELTAEFPERFQKHKEAS